MNPAGFISDADMAKLEAQQAPPAGFISDADMAKLEAQQAQVAPAPTTSAASAPQAGSTGIPPVTYLPSGAQLAQNVKDTVTGVPKLLGGVLETGMAAGSGLAATVAGDMLGMSNQLAKDQATVLGKVLGWDDAQTKSAQDWVTGGYKPEDIERGIKRTFTYQPQTETGQAIQGALSSALTPLTKLTNSVGALVGAATQRPVIGDVAGDVVGAAAPYGVTKALGGTLNTAAAVPGAAKAAWQEIPAGARVPAAVATVGSITHALMGHPLGPIASWVGDSIGALGGIDLLRHIGKKLGEQRAALDTARAAREADAALLRESGPLGLSAAEAERLANNFFATPSQAELAAERSAASALKLNQRGRSVAGVISGADLTGVGDERRR